MASDYSIQGYSWKCSDSAETTNVWKDSPEAAAATRPVMEKLRELEGMASFKGNLFRPVFSYNFRGYPGTIPSTSNRATGSPSTCTITRRRTTSSSAAGARR